MEQGLQTLSFGDFSIRVLVLGSGSPVLYLHGYEGHPGEASFLKALAADRVVIAPEFPGYGESHGFEAIDGVLASSLFFRKLLETLDTGPVDVIGHCLGGMLAAEFAAVSPHLTRTLTLVGPYGLWLEDPQMPDPFTMSEKELKAANWADPDNAPEMPSIFVTDPANPSGKVLERAKNLAIATKFMWPIADRGLRGRLQYINAPTLIIRGEKDGLVPAPYAGEFASLIPNSRAVTIPAAGHLPMVEREHDFLAALRSHLA